MCGTPHILSEYHIVTCIFTYGESIEKALIESARVLMIIWDTTCLDYSVHNIARVLFEMINSCIVTSDVKSVI